jgi:hypothetical protein
VPYPGHLAPGPTRAVRLHQRLSSDDLLRILYILILCRPLPPLPSPFSPYSVPRMATRRLSSACIATSSRAGLAPALRPRQARLVRAAAMPTARYLHSTPTRYEHAANSSAKRDAAPPIVRGASKLFKSADEAVADLKSGSTILSAGFGVCGTAGKKRIAIAYVLDLW